MEDKAETLHLHKNYNANPCHGSSTRQLANGLIPLAKSAWQTPARVPNYAGVPQEHDWKILKAMIGSTLLFMRFKSLQHASWSFYSFRFRWNGGGNLSKYSPQFHACSGCKGSSHQWLSDSGTCGRRVTVVVSQLQLFRDITSSQRSQTCRRLQNLYCHLGTFQPPNQRAWDSALYAWFKAPARKLQYGTKKDCFNLVYLCKSAPNTIKSFFFYPKWHLWLHLLLYTAHRSHQMDGIRSLLHLLESKVWLTPFAGLESGNWTSLPLLPYQPPPVKATNPAWDNANKRLWLAALLGAMCQRYKATSHCVASWQLATAGPIKSDKSPGAVLWANAFKSSIARNHSDFLATASINASQSLVMSCFIRMKSKMENKSESQIIRLSRISRWDCKKIAMRTDSFNEKQFCRRDLVQCPIFSCLLGGIGLASTFLHLHKLQWQHQKQADLLMALLRKAAMPRPISFGEVLDERAPKRKACEVYVQNSPPKKEGFQKQKAKTTLDFLSNKSLVVFARVNCSS